MSIKKSGSGLPEGAVQVLDKGFVRLTDQLGSDITPVNAARISFGKEVSSFDEGRDGKLLKFLAGHGHTSPFRHAVLQFHIKAPEVVMRQWWKHIIGCDWTASNGLFNDTGWNEISGRYVEFTPEFYVPSAFRPQASDNKQASVAGDLGGIFLEWEFSPAHQAFEEVEVREAYERHLERCFEIYEKLVEAGVAKEQARMVLPMSLYVESYWTASLQAVAHFCKLRIHEGAQFEIQEFAKAIQGLAEKAFPNAFANLMEA